MADGSTPITGYTDNGLTPIINPESGYVEEGFTDTEYENRWQKGVSNMYVNREPRFLCFDQFCRSHLAYIPCKQLDRTPYARVLVYGRGWQE